MGRVIEKTYVCPFCGEKFLFIGVHDDEGNYHGRIGCEYEQAPWSGLSYALHHDGWGDCVLCTDGASGVMGGILFDTAQEAAEAIPALPQPSKEPLPGWVSVKDGMPERGGKYLVATMIGAVSAVHFYPADNGHSGRFADWRFNMTVTHWMPLPAAPEEGQGGEV